MPDPSSPRNTVVLLHGLAASRWTMKPLQRHLQQQGFATLNWAYPSLRGDIETHARRLTDTLQDLSERPAVASIDLVTHSMGSIVARTALLESRFQKVQNCVMLGPPNHGSRVAAVLSRQLGWLCKPLGQLADQQDSYVNQLPPPQGINVGIIAAAFDRVVAVHSTHLGIECAHQVVPSGHTSMLFRRDVACCVSNFLRTGRFQESLANAC